MTPAETVQKQLNYHMPNVKYNVKEFSVKSQFNGFQETCKFYLSNVEFCYNQYRKHEKKNKLKKLWFDFNHMQRSVRAGFEFIITFVLVINSVKFMLFFKSWIIGFRKKNKGFVQWNCPYCSQRTTRFSENMPPLCQKRLICQMQFSAPAALRALIPFEGLSFQL